MKFKEFPCELNLEKYEIFTGPNKPLPKIHCSHEMLLDMDYYFYNLTKIKTKKITKKEIKDWQEIDRYLDANIKNAYKRVQIIKEED